MWLFKHHLQQKLADDYSLVALKGIILAIALVLVVAALTINNKWVLGGMALWVVLP